MLPLGGRNLFSSVPFWLGLAYVTFPMGLLLYGWNDYVHFDVARVNPRKGSLLFGARGTIEQLRRLPLRIALVQAPFLVAFCYLRGWRLLVCLAGMVAAAAVYNWPRYGFKSRPPLEILNQAGYLFVFLLSSWTNRVPQLRWPALYARPDAVRHACLERNRPRHHALGLVEGESGGVAVRGNSFVRD